MCVPPVLRAQKSGQQPAVGVAAELARVDERPHNLVRFRDCVGPQHCHRAQFGRLGAPFFSAGAMPTRALRKVSAKGLCRATAKSVAKRAMRCDASPPHIASCRRDVSFSAAPYSTAGSLRGCPVASNACPSRPRASRYLNGNKISGSLPSSLTSMTRLKTLFVVVVSASLSARGTAVVREPLPARCVAERSRLARAAQTVLAHVRVSDVPAYPGT